MYIYKSHSTHYIKNHVYSKYLNWPSTFISPSIRKVRKIDGGRVFVLNSLTPLHPDF